MKASENIHSSMTKYLGPQYNVGVTMLQAYDI